MLIIGLKGLNINPSQAGLFWGVPDPCGKGGIRVIINFVTSRGFEEKYSDNETWRVQLAVRSCFICGPQNGTMMPDKKKIE